MGNEEFFKALNNFFDKIYVITLRRATERHQHFQKELAGLNYTVFYGQDKLEFDVEELKQKNIYNEALAKKHHRYGKPMTAGMIGCSWSHKLIYEDVVNNGYQRVLILEDDVVIDTRAASVFQKTMQQLPANWELLYLGFAANEKPPAGAWLKKSFYHLLRLLRLFPYTHKTIQHLYPQKKSEVIYRAGYHDCTHAYALTQKAAQTLLQLQTPISFVADNLLAYAVTNQLVKGYIVLPRIIHQQYQVSGADVYSYLNH